MKMKVSYMAMPGVIRLSNREKSKLVSVFSSEIIINICCLHFNKSIDQLQTKQRFRELVLPRQVIMYFLSEYTDMTYSLIGRLFNRDHTTAIHSKDLIKDLMATDEEFKEQMDGLKRRIADSH